MVGVVGSSPIAPTNPANDGSIGDGKVGATHHPRSAAVRTQDLRTAPIDPRRDVPSAQVRPGKPRPARSGPIPRISALHKEPLMTSSRRGGAAGDTPQSEASGPRVLKKYPNRRLYDTQASSYITLADVKRMVLANEDFEVRDAKTGDDLTRSILLQIILEEESGGVPMFSSEMLAQIIRFYGNAMQGMMGSYLEKNIQTFVELQKRFADNSKLTPEVWTQFLNGQAPMLQSLVASYFEQSRALFTQMQEQMRLPETLFPGIKR
jgi:polyhydroxyalkanoate synthesis repressor PhaR